MESEKRESKEPEVARYKSPQAFGAVAGSVAQEPELPRLGTKSLEEALLDMPVGTAALPPENASYGYVKSACSRLRARGYQFITSIRTGRAVVTRLS